MYLNITPDLLGAASLSGTTSTHIITIVESVLPNIGSWRAVDIRRYRRHGAGFRNQAIQVLDSRLVAEIDAVVDGSEGEPIVVI